MLYPRYLTYLTSCDVESNSARPYMREMRETPGYVRDPKLNDIFPGGAVHTRALRAGRERGQLRSFDHLVIPKPPALGGGDGDGGGGGGALPESMVDEREHGEVDAASSAAASGANHANNASSAADGDALGPTSSGDGHAPASAAGAWGTGDVLGGLLVNERGTWDEGAGLETAAATVAATAAAAGEQGVTSAATASTSGVSSSTTSDEDAADADADMGAMELTATERQRRGAEVGAAIAAGAIANSGALPPPQDWPAASHQDLSPSEVPWLVAQEVAEARAVRAMRERRAREAASAAAAHAASAGSIPSSSSSLATSTSEVPGGGALAALDDTVEDAYAKMVEWFESKGGRLEGRGLHSSTFQLNLSRS